MDTQKMLDIFRFVEWIKVIAITGGPCSGKSTFLKMAIQLLEKYRIKVIVVPEAAREFISAGITPWDACWKDPIDFQRQLFLAILEREYRYFEALKQMNLGGQRVVIFCDRGLVDGMAYCGEEAYKAMLNYLGLSFASVLDRYDGVFHLVTAAAGAEDFYITDGERHETPEQARALDARTLAAWQEHQHLSVVDNSTAFSGKINRALKALQRILSMPVQLEIEKKYRVDNFSPDKIPPGSKSFMIWQTYLDRPDRPGIECRIRMKVTDGECSCYYTEKTPTQTDGVRGELEEQITINRYRELGAAYSRQDWRVVEKERYKWVFGSRIIELDVYKGELEGLVTLEVEFESVEARDSFQPPSEFSLTDVTADSRFSNSSLAIRGMPDR